MSLDEEYENAKRKEDRRNEESAFIEKTLREDPLVENDNITKESDGKSLIFNFICGIRKVRLGKGFNRYNLKVEPNTKNKKINAINKSFSTSKEVQDKYLKTINKQYKGTIEDVLPKIMDYLKELNE